MNSAERRQALRQLFTAKFVHARLLGIDVGGFAAPTRWNVHRLQKAINLRTKK